MARWMSRTGPPGDSPAWVWVWVVLLVGASVGIQLAPW